MSNDTAELQEERYEIAGHGVHIAQRFENQWTVWLNTELQDYDGLCIGCGDTRQEAVTQAVMTLEAVVAHLRFGLVERLVTEEAQ